MKLLILGPTGGVGRQLVSQAIAAGHETTVLARSRAYEPAPSVRCVRGEVLEGPALAEAVRGQDAVLCSIGHQRRHPANPWSSPITPPDAASAAARRIVLAMTEAGVRRVVAVSAAGVGDSAPSLNGIMRFFLATTMIGAAYRDLDVMEQVYAASGLDWLCPRPTRLTNAVGGAPVRVTSSFGAADDIGRADVASWMIAALESSAWPEAAWGSRTPQITRAR